MRLVQQIPQLLPVDSCRELIDFSERCGFLKQRFGESYPAEIRRRVAVDDASVARMVWRLLQPQLRPLAEYYDRQLLAASGVNISDYSMVGLNDRLRFYKYQQGERFARHPDVAFVKDACERSLLSVIIYLNDDFDGGETTFDECIVRPKTGAAIVFAHELEHEGMPVSQGIKRVVRTDVMAQLASHGD